MAKWIRFQYRDIDGIGTLEGDSILVHQGDLFAAPRPTDTRIPLAEVTLRTPCDPGKMICLWNNFHALADRLHFTPPAAPLYFLKAPTAFQAGGTTIPRPPSYAGRVLFEGELGIVIGRRCAGIAAADAPSAIFGYTCVNDVTAIDLLTADPAFAQWTRAKGFDGFGPFGPVIATGLDPHPLVVRTILDGRERQNYPVADMFFEPAHLVSLISHDMTLLPGDIISCGTSLGASSLKPRSQVDIVIDGIGTLSNVMG